MDQYLYTELTFSEHLGLWMAIMSWLELNENMQIPNVEIFLFFFLCFDHVGWSKLLLITPPNGQMCLLSIERKMFVWIWRVFRITKSNLLYICWYDLYPFSAEAMLRVHLCLNSLKHTLQLSPSKILIHKLSILTKTKYLKILELPIFSLLGLAVHSVQ